MNALSVRRGMKSKIDIFAPKIYYENKKAYLSMITGIEKNKLSRLLKGTQTESGTDMEVIAEALGQNVEYFLSDSFDVPKISGYSLGKMQFYAGNLSEKQENIAGRLMELMENIDEIMSAKSRFENIAR